jgi:uncharacterized protein YcbX
MVNDARPVGTVAALWRYPVKSMKGEPLQAADVTAGGTVGDRAYAVVDVETGKVASAKHPRKWGRLLECEAAFVEEPVVGGPAPAVRIALPDGATVRSDAKKPGVDDALSALFGRPVTLTSAAPDHGTLEELWPDIEGLAPAEFIEHTKIAGGNDDETVSEIAIGLAAPAGTFYDLAVLHVLTTSTLTTLEGFYPEGRFAALRYRPNVLIDTAEAGFVENDWPGQTLEFGAGLRAAVSIPTMRCIMTTLAQDDLPKNPELLRTIARHNRIEIAGLGHWACAGAYAGVSVPGPVRVGDPVTLQP